LEVNPELSVVKDVSIGVTNKARVLEVIGLFPEVQKWRFKV